MANTNCLEEKRCPKCGNENEIVVYASMWVSLQDSGTDPLGNSTKNCGGVDYDEDSDARCPACDYEGKLSEWDVATPRGNAMIQSVRWRLRLRRMYHSQTMGISKRYGSG